MNTSGTGCLLTGLEVSAHSADLVERLGKLDQVVIRDLRLGWLMVGWGSAPELLTEEVRLRTVQASGIGRPVACPDAW